MTTPTRLNVSAAQDAVARLDEGTARPGDEQLAAAYDAHCRQAHDNYVIARCNAELSAWVAEQCPGCVTGGGGEACGYHWLGSLELDGPATTSPYAATTTPNPEGGEER